MHIDFNKMLIIQKTHAVLMLSIRHLIYVSLYVCCLKLIFVIFLVIFFMKFKMNCISNHNIMLLATSLLRIYQNYVLYGTCEIGDCIYVIVLALSYHSSYPPLYVNFV